MSDSPKKENNMSDSQKIKPAASSSELLIQQNFSSLVGRMNKLLVFWSSSRIFLHDMKNPLAGIFGTTQVLLDEFEENTPERRLLKEMLKQMAKMDTKMSVFASSLKSFGPSEEPCHLNDTAEMLRFLIAPRLNVPVIINKLNEADLCFIDPHLTVLALQNLIIEYAYGSNLSRLSMNICYDDSSRLLRLEVGFDGQQKVSIPNSMSFTKKTDITNISLDILNSQGVIIIPQNRSIDGASFAFVFPSAERN